MSERVCVVSYSGERVVMVSPSMSRQQAEACRASWRDMLKNDRVEIIDAEAGLALKQRMTGSH